MPPPPSSMPSPTRASCISIPADLSDTAGLDAFVSTLREHTDSVDILVNNAGAAWGAPLGEFPDVGFDKVMNINVKAPFMLTQALLPELEAGATADDPARVIMIGSIDGIRVPIGDNYSYSAAKAGIHMLARHLGSTRRRAPHHGQLDRPRPVRVEDDGIHARGRRQRATVIEPGSPQADRHGRGHRRHGDLPRQPRRRVHDRGDDSRRRRHLDDTDGLRPPADSAGVPNRSLATVTGRNELRRVGIDNGPAIGRTRCRTAPDRSYVGAGTGE